MKTDTSPWDIVWGSLIAWVFFLCCAMLASGFGLLAMAFIFQTDIPTGALAMVFRIDLVIATIMTVLGLLRR